MAASDTALVPLPHEQIHGWEREERTPEDRRYGQRDAVQLFRAPEDEVHGQHGGELHGDGAFSVEGQAVGAISRKDGKADASLPQGGDHVGVLVAGLCLFMKTITHPAR